MLLIWTALLVVSCASAQGTEKYAEMPYHLRVTQRMENETVKKSYTLAKTTPDTVNDALDAEMRALVEEMAERGKAHIPAATRDSLPHLDVGPVISRTGTKWMSFLTLSEITHEKELVYMEHDARVYDVETGERITLADIFPPESEAWAMLAQAVREQLTAAFPDETPDEAVLDALCETDALREASFTLGAARLMLVYRADSLYPDRHTLLHVALNYRDIRPHMTEAAAAQTDNSRFTMVALTFDDGGAGGTTRRVMDALREYGAQATFFLVGKQLRSNHYNMARQQNSAYSIQYHSYTHQYMHKMRPETALEEKLNFAAEMASVIGVTPTMMRAPGGDEAGYVAWRIGFPMIHWSAGSFDSGNNDVRGIYTRVVRIAKDGDIVLMHDINPYAPRYTKLIVERFNEKGILAVTVDDLFARDGVELEPDHIYYRTDNVTQPEDVVYE